MKVSWSSILSSIYCSAAVASASRVGHVFLWDRSTKHIDNGHPTSVNPQTARLIISQRLGLSKYHSLKGVNAGAIAQLNEYGGPSQQLFRDEGAVINDANVLVWIEGVDVISDIIPQSSDFAKFTISNPPAASDNERLIEDFVFQAKSLAKKADPLLLTYHSGISIEKALQPVTQLSGNQLNTYNEYLSILHLENSGVLKNKENLKTLSDSLIELLRQAQTYPFSVTLVFMPAPSSNIKRSVNPYGTYSLPSPVEISPRREKPEAVLSSPSSPESSPLSQNISASSPDMTLQINAAPVLGILPTCFESLDVCQRRTQNCTGHGACYLAKKSGSAQGKNCYSCQCKATVVQVGKNGKKTTNWGGPACQKKDIVIPFWLLAGSTVMLMFLIGGGIGMLYSIGSEELPSVIGAGVSGPARK